MRLSSLALLLTAAPALAQPAADPTAHRLPFASAGNAVELAVANSADAALGGLTVALIATPPWLRFVAEAAAVGEIAPGAESAAAFAFDVAPEAPVGQTAELTFEVRARSAVVGTRTLRVVVDPPREVALTGPWPNPVSGRARLAVELPAEGAATLVLYDVLGRAVAHLLDGEHTAGRHEVALDAAALAAGAYVLRLTAADGAGAPATRVRRLTVVR
jgi:hypothetical protein